VAIPAGEEPPFVADFATTPVARGKLAMMEKRGEEAPLGFVQDAAGVASTDPAIITHGGAIVPLGGDREHGSHKGYCMSAIVDILSAVLPGANFGPFVPPQVSYLEPREDMPGKGLGHFFGAMRIDAFQQADDFKRMMDLWIRTFRAAKPADGQLRVYIPGDIERESELRQQDEGIILNPKVLEDLDWVCGELGLQGSH
jgi:L-2-hydroxycarboxylate dehydrogenase (NAD+)